MELLIAILIWLGVLTSGQTYTNEAYQQYLQQNSQQISNVIGDSVLQQDVWNASGSSVRTVIIFE
jgi:hypothetical protein